MSPLLQVLAERVPRERVADGIRSVLARERFQDERSILEDFLQALFEEHPGGLATAGEVAARVLLGVLIALVLYALYRLVRARLAARRGDGPGGATAVRETASARLFADARAARARGELRLALRLAFLALVVGLGERGDLRYHDAWTYREILRRGRPGRAAHEVLAPLVRELEAKEFGRELPSEDDVDRLEALCRRHLARPVAVGGRP